MADEASLVHFERFVLDLQGRELKRAGEVIPLRPKTLALLIYLVENRHRVVPKQELLRAVWPGLRIEVQGIYQSVAELRAAFGGRHFIRTVRSAGYQWVGESGAVPDSRNRLRPSAGDFLRVVVGPAIAACAALLMLAASLVPDASRSTVAFTPDSGPEALVEQASTYFAAGKLATAERALSSAVESNPQHLGARLGLAQVRFARGERASALRLAREVYRDAMALGAPNIRMQSALLLSEFTDRQDTASARDFAHEVVELANRFHSPLVAAAGHERLGDIYLAQGERILAGFQFDEAAKGYKGNCPSGEARVGAKLQRLTGPG